MLRFFSSPYSSSIKNSFLGESKNFSARMFSSNDRSVYEARFIPQLSKDSKVILPISMTRYDADKVKRKQYDKEIETLLTYTAQRLEAGSLGSFEVLSTTGLQEVNWSKEKAREIESYFVDAHGKMLEKQTAFYDWNTFVHKLGKDKFENSYDAIKRASEPGTDWYKMMLKTSQSVNVSGDLEKSLEYQRKEYAIILSMKGTYTNIASMGNISLGWSYLYQQYKDLPMFTRVIIGKTKKQQYINTSEASSMVRMILRNMEEILVNENFPQKEKIKLGYLGTSLFQAYIPKSDLVEDKLNPKSQYNKGILA